MQVEGLVVPQAPPRVRVFGAEDLHLTLCFLGAVPEEDARRAWAGAQSFQTWQAVEGTFDEVAPLGHPRKPSALTAIVQEGRDAFSAMIMEARGPVLAAAGAQPDVRPPLPHMTIARIQRRADRNERREALSWMRTIDVGHARFRATDVALYTWSTERQLRLFEVVDRRQMRL